MLWLRTEREKGFCISGGDMKRKSYRIYLNGDSRRSCKKSIFISKEMYPKQFDKLLSYYKKNKKLLWSGNGAIVNREQNPGLIGDPDKVLMSYRLLVLVLVWF